MARWQPLGLGRDTEAWQGGSRLRAEQTVRLVSLLIDGIWLRCGLRIGGLDRYQAVAEIEAMIAARCTAGPERLAARARMALPGKTLPAGRSPG